MQFIKGEAPRITPMVIEENISGENYFTAAEGALGAGMPHTPAMELLTFCVLTLRNGFTVVGKSACASPENYDRDMGQKIAREDAVRQIWALMGYELRSQLQRLADVKPAEFSEALTRMLAQKLGNGEAFRTQDIEAVLDHVTGNNLEEGPNAEI